jgi:HK97 family phage major capsid protein
MTALLSDQIKPAYEATTAAAKAANAKLQEAKADALQKGHDLTVQDSPAFLALSELADAKVNADMAAAAATDKYHTALRIDGIQADPEVRANAPELQAQLLDAMKGSQIEQFSAQAIGSESYKRIQSVLSQGAGGWGGPAQLGNALSDREFKALVTGASDTSGGAFIIEDRKGYIPLAERALSIRNLVSVLATTSDLVHYIRQATAPDAAAFGAAATTVAPGAEDGLAPEGSISFTTETSAIKDIKETIPVHKNAFADAPQLQGIIENALHYDHVKTLEDEMVAGSGVGDTHLYGLNPQITQTLDGNIASDNDLAVVRKLITLIQIANEDSPNGVLVNPVDAEYQDLLRTNAGGAGTGEYLSGSPWAAGPNTLWGLPRIVTNAQTAGQVTVGNFKRSTLHLRQGPQALASDSHKDWFARSVVALMLVGRYGFTVERPNSFAYGTFDR